MRAKTTPSRAVVGRTTPAPRCQVRLLDPGYKTGLALIAPFDLAIDDEYWRWAGPDLVLHITRTGFVDHPVSVELAEAVGDLAAVREAARSIAHVRPAASAYACTSGSFVSGLVGERALREVMGAAGLANPITTSGALLDALVALGAWRVGVGTPYDDAVSRRLTTFLHEAGYTVVSGANLGLRGDISRVAPDTVAELALAADDASADVVFLSCTNLRTFDVIADAEHILGKPVLSANQVTMWRLLQLAMAPSAAGGQQRLFRDTSAPVVGLGE